MENTVLSNPRIEDNQITVDELYSFSNARAKRQYKIDFDSLKNLIAELEGNDLCDAINGIIFSYARLASFILNSDDGFLRDQLIGANDRDLYHLKILQDTLKNLKVECVQIE